MAPPMDFVCYADWEQLPESANALFAKSGEGSIFFSRPWLENLSNTALRDDQAMLLASVVEGGNVLAILPLMKCNSEHWYGLTHLYSSLYTLLLSERNQHETLKRLVQGLSQLPFDCLRLAPVAQDDSNMQKLRWTMESCGYECHRYFRFYNWIHRLKGRTFKDYMDARPARVRNTIARKQRKLDREHGYVIRLFTDRHLEQALADYNAVYKASWKANELFGGFIEGLAKSFSEPGWLRLPILYIDEQPAAAQFWFVAHRKASIFKLAYDEAWKRYSPGSILLSYMMERVIDTDQVREIDFLTGNDAYKQDWMSERRERWGLYCVKPRKPEGKAERILGLLKSMGNPLQGAHG